MTIKEFTDKFLMTAEAVESKTGVPAMLILAMAALETGWGEHAPGNNFFGIKAGKSYEGPSKDLDTKEFIDGKLVKVNAKFRSYQSPEESFLDFANLLKKNWAAAVKLKDPVQIITRIQSYKTKYATDPLYASKVDRIINKIKKNTNVGSEIKMDNEIKVIARGADKQPVKFITNFETKEVALPEQPGVELGTDELHDVVVFGVDSGNALIKTFEDGKVKASDAINFIAPAMSLPAAISGLNMVPAELDDLDAEEIKAEIDYVKEKLNVDDEKAKNIVVKSINAAYANYELVKAIKE